MSRIATPVATVAEFFRCLSTRETSHMVSGIAAVVPVRNTTGSLQYIVMSLARQAFMRACIYVKSLTFYFYDIEKVNVFEACRSQIPALCSLTLKESL